MKKVNNSIATKLCTNLLNNREKINFFLVHYKILSLNCVVHYNSLVFLRLFSKFAYIFVAIELLTFFINAKFHFYCSRKLLGFGLENKSVRKQDWFFDFCVYKNVFAKQLLFVYEWKLQWIPSAKNNVHVLYIQKGKNCKTI